MEDYQQASCDKCSSPVFDYDSYYKEYSCKNCGWIVEDHEKRSLLDKIRNSELNLKRAIQHDSSKPTEERQINKENIEKMELWWAYVHERGSIEVKSWYPGNNHLNQARVSPYVKRFLERPFKAESFEEAERIAKQLLKDIRVEGVTFVEMKYRDGYTYEVYTSEDKEKAWEFIKTKSVNEKHYYIEVCVGDVNDPEVILGVDIMGTYEA
jgi:hypothetical protein